MTEDEQKMKPPFIAVQEFSTGKVIGRVKLNSTNDKHVELVMRGMLRNLHDGLFLEEVLK